MKDEEHHLASKGDSLLLKLNDGIRIIIKLLAILMMFVIVLCVADVVFVI